MSAQHTPGPWGVDWKSGDVFYLDGDVMPLVATVNLDAVSNEQALADLRLIAAAPELLGALEKLVRDARPSNWDDDEDMDQWQAWLAADAAIAKARGEA